MTIVSLSQAELDKAYMDGILDMEHAVEAWFRTSIDRDAASDEMFNTLMKAMHDGCRLSDQRLEEMRALISSNDGGKCS